MRKQTLGLAVLSVVVILASWLIGNHLPAPARTQAQTTGGLVILKPYTLKATLYRQGQIIDNITAAVRSDGSYVMNRRFFPETTPTSTIADSGFLMAETLRSRTHLAWFGLISHKPRQRQRRDFSTGLTPIPLVSQPITRHSKDGVESWGSVLLLSQMTLKQPSLF